MKLITNNTYDELVRAAEAARDKIPVVRCRFCKWRPRNMGTGVEVQQLSFPLDSESIEICPCAAGDPWYNIEPDPNGYCWKGEWDDKEGD